MKSPASATGRALLILVLVLPLIVAAIALAGTSKDLTVAWTRDAQAAQEDAAPGAGGVDPQQLAAAKQATAAAAAQAGFLDASVGAVVDGSVQLKDGTTQAASGSVQLRDGMVELQAGVGQLGAGAREISYGVTQLVDSAEQLLALQGQVLLAVEEFKTQAAAEGATPEEMAMIEQAHQALLDNTFDEEQASRLPELRSGAQELSRQLNTPGAAFHDGVYTATEASKQLASGLAELDSGAGALQEGVDKVQEMSTLNAERAQAAQRSLPQVTTTAAEGEEEASVVGMAPSLAWMIGLLIAASAVMVCGLQARRHESTRQLLIRIGGGSLAIAALGAVAFVLSSTGLDLARGVMGVGLIALAALGYSAFAAGLLKVVGTVVGRILTVSGVILQALVVGLVWLRPDIVGLWRTIIDAIAGALPVHYLTAGLTSAGNDGDPAALYWAFVVTAAVAAVGVVVLVVHQRTVARTGTDAGVDDGAESAESAEYVEDITAEQPVS